MATYYMDPVNGNDSADGLGWHKVSYGGGSGSEPAVGETLTGATSGATAKVISVTGWPTSGTIYLYNKSGTFQMEETGNFSGGSSTILSSADSVSSWKTITSGATAARIAPADIIRIAKSSDPTSLGMTAAWTNLSKTVTLNSALTATVELCETAWTASANVTAEASSICKEGTESASLAIASGFTTGLAAYKTITTIDLSGYKQVSFWIRANAAIAASVLQLKLCSDTAGATPVDTINIPAVPGTNVWQVVTVDLGAALGSAIQSVALYAASDPGTVTVLIDDIIACKDSANADSLTLSSLISKTSAAQGGTEGWYGIQSIDGTTILLDNSPDTSASAGRGYSGTTETVTTYKRETIKTTPASGGFAVQAIQDSGSSGNLIEFQGGYDITTNTQNGESFFDGQNGLGFGVGATSKSYFKLNYISTVRYNGGIYFSTVTDAEIVNATTLSNCGNGGLYIDGTSTRITVTSIIAANNCGNHNIYIDSNVTLCNFTFIGSASNSLAYGINLSSCKNNTFTTITKINNNGSSYGLYLSGCVGNVFTTISNVSYNNGVGVQFDSPACRNTINTLSNVVSNTVSGINFSTNCNYNLIKALGSLTSNVTGIVFAGCRGNVICGGTISGHTTAVTNNSGKNYLRNTSISESTEFASATNFADSRLYSWKHDQTADNHYIYTDGGTIISQTTTRHTASGIAWKYAVSSSNRKSEYPLGEKIAEVAVAASAQVTFKAWVKKDHATDIGARLVCRGGQLAGVSNDVVATKANDTNWEELTLTFTPTEAGVIKIDFEVYYVTANSNAYLDDLTVSQA